MDAEMSLKDLFWDAVEAHGDQPAQSWFDGDEWRTRNYTEFAASIRDVANGLLALGIKRGDRVALWSKNTPRWAEVDWADQSMGFATVPIYDTLTADQATYILNDAGAKVLFVQDKEMLEKALEHRGAQGTIKHYIVMAGRAPKQDDVMSYSQLIKEGKEFAKKHPKRFDNARARVKPGDLASLVYTSGTTGDPKGVMLTQANFGSNAAVARTCVDFGPGDKFLSFLPLSHVFERTGGHFAAYTAGSQVVFARSVEALVEDMATHRPTIMMSVPRLYEKIHARITSGVAKAPWLKRKIFEWAMAQGRAANVYVQRNEPVPPGLQKKLDRANKLVFNKLRNAVGGNIRYFVSGGAALSKDIEEFFWAAGIHILQGYGLTETSPVINVNRPGAIRFGSVGRPVPGAEIKIDTKEWQSQRDDVVEGEICVRGPMVMQGYFNNKKATDEVMDDEGFFHTGDIGFVDDDGFLFITDRKKEIIVMSNGKNVAPQRIEGMLKLQPHIALACAIGDDKKYMSALIVPDFEALEEFAKENGITNGDRKKLVSDQRIVSLIEAEVEAVNRNLSRYEQIKKWWILADDWQPGGEELTPTLKIKRRVVAKKYEDEIQSLYATR